MANEHLMPTGDEWKDVPEFNEAWDAEDEFGKAISDFAYLRDQGESVAQSDVEEAKEKLRDAYSRYEDGIKPFINYMKEMTLKNIENVGHLILWHEILSSKKGKAIAHLSWRDMRYYGEK